MSLNKKAHRKRKPSRRPKTYSAFHFRYKSLFEDFVKLGRIRFSMPRNVAKTTLHHLHILRGYYKDYHHALHRYISEQESEEMAQKTSKIWMHLVEDEANKTNAILILEIDPAYTAPTKPIPPENAL